jgi:hypothetical protein
LPAAIPADIASSVVIQTNALTLTSLYTGTLGNTIGFNVSNGPVQGTYNGVVTMGSQVPEVYIGISAGVAALAVTPGTYTVCPTLLSVGELITALQQGTTGSMR